MKIVPEKIWLVEYSVEQRVFHIQTLQETADGNLQKLLQEEAINDYAVVAVARTSEEAHQICALIADQIENRRPEN